MQTALSRTAVPLVMNILYKNVLSFLCILRHYITCLRVFVQNI